jgi:hypothetical protein
LIDDQHAAKEDGIMPLGETVMDSDDIAGI